jgi:hypothetical protein
MGSRSVGISQAHDHRRYYSTISQRGMNYVKYFRSLDFDVVEQTLNEFFADISKKGHRVMHTKYVLGLNNVSVIITINDEPHPRKKA